MLRGHLLGGLTAIGGLSVFATCPPPMSASSHRLHDLDAGLRPVRL
jgi:hypothetical protein